MACLRGTPAAAGARGAEPRPPSRPPRGCSRLPGSTASCVRSHRAAHVLARVTPKQTLPTGCPWSQSRRRLSTLTRSARSICHSLKIESSLRSGQVRPRCVRAAAPGEEGRAQPHSRGSGFPAPGRAGGALPAATLEGLLHNSHGLWNVSGICSVTVSLHK